MTVIIKRHTTAHMINEVVNHPDVYKWVHGNYKGPMDLTPLVLNPYNYLLMGEYGGVMFTMHQPGLYEAHTQVLPAGRGKWTLDMVNACIAWMFTRTDAVELITRVPKGNLGARALVRSIHATFEFRREDGWVMDGKSVYTDMYSLSIQTWMRTAPGLTERGLWFHNRIDTELHDKGIHQPEHVDTNTVHNQYVGAACEMVLGKQPHKALVFYNRWAVMSGYSPLSMVTETPLVLDVGNNVLIVVRNENFWVMTG